MALERRIGANSINKINITYERISSDHLHSDLKIYVMKEDTKRMRLNFSHQLHRGISNEREIHVWNHKGVSYVAIFLCRKFGNTAFINLWHSRQISIHTGQCEEKNIEFVWKMEIWCLKYVHDVVLHVAKISRNMATLF